MIFGQTQQVSPITPEELGRVIQTRETPADEYFGAVVEDAFEHSLPGAMLAEIQLPDDDLTGRRDHAAQDAFFREHHRLPMTKEEVLSVMERSNVPTMTQEEWEASPYYRKEVPFDNRMTEARAKAKAEVYDADHYRAWLRQNRPWGVGTVAMAITGSLIGSAPDPVNYIPGFGAAFRAANEIRIAAMMTRAGLGALDAAVATAATEPIIANSRRQFGEDITFADQVMDVALGAAVGGAAGGLHGQFEHIPLSIAELHPEHASTALQALGEVADAVATDRPLEADTGRATATMASLRQEIRAAIARVEQEWAERIAAGWTRPTKRGGDSLAAAKGRAAHAVLEAWLIRKAQTAPGWEYEAEYRDGSGRIYKPDILTPRGYIIELKPRTESGKRRGEKQKADYERVTNRRVRVIYYDP